MKNDDCTYKEKVNETWFLKLPAAYSACVKLKKATPDWLAMPTLVSYITCGNPNIVVN